MNPTRTLRPPFVLTPHVLSSVLACSLLVGPALPSRAAEAPPDTTPVGQIRSEARALEPLVRSQLARDFLRATATLPHVESRTLWHDSSRTRWWSAREVESLPDTQRARLVRRELDEAFYYNTRYGSPLAYARPLEILAESGLRSVAGKRIADFGYGTVGHLRLLASLGADVTGIEVDPALRALYSEPGDQGTIGTGARAGRLRLVHGRWPGDTATTLEGKLELFLSKNTLKNGYIHPAEKVDPRMTIRLGVDDATFVRALYRALAPGGRVLLYNLCPAPNAPGKPYIPWADGRCPFPEALWKAEGFRVVAFDRDDTGAARAMGHALGWDAAGPGAMDLAKDLFGSYSLFVKPAGAKR